MRIEGRFFDGTSSRSRRASAVIENDRLWVEGEGGEMLLAPLPPQRVELSSRIGNAPRFLRFPGGASFETQENDAVDLLSAQRSPTSGFVHRLESKLRYVLVGLAVTVSFMWAGAQWAVPALARVAAFALPVDVNRHADDVVLKIFDQRLLQPSRLPQETQTRLLAAFRPFTEDAAQHPPVHVLFRDAEGSIGANALALPAGTIIFTDQLVQRAQHDEELIGVLAHEIGHVHHRHAMRSSLQASFLGLIATLAVGDISSVSSAITALPLMLTELGYSRAFEQEADQYAVDTLSRHGIAAQYFVDILQRIDPDAEEKGGYLSTHPPTPERVRSILAASGGQKP